MTNISELRPMDRVLITNSEFDEWLPTEATVLSLGVIFPHSEPPIRRLRIKVRMDNHPFSKILIYKMCDLSWEEDHPTIVAELLTGV